MGTLQLAQEMTQPVVLVQRTVALGNGHVALSHHATDQGAQRFDVIGKGIGEIAHEE